MGITQLRSPNHITVSAGDGVTDNTAALQAAINASPVGSVIEFGGNHLVSSTIILKAQRTYLGPIWATQSTPTFFQKNGSNLPAVLASDEWYNNSATCGYPIVLRNIMVDANSANNTTSHGIVVMNFDSVVSECTVQNTPGVGIMASSVSRNGTSISNSCVEIRIEKCKTISTGSYGIYGHDTNGHLTDGYVENCIVQSPADFGIYLERGAGWFVRQNHLYGCAKDGISAVNCWATQIKDNEIDGFGSGAAGFYNGINAVLIGPRATIVEGNSISVSNEIDATTYQYITVTGGGIDPTKAIVSNNAIQGGYVSTTATTSLVSGAKTPCAPLTMDGIAVGSVLFVQNETITVASVTSTTFTPSTNWVNNHGTGSYFIGSNKSAGTSLGLLATSNGTQQGSGFPFTVVSFGNRVDMVGHFYFYDSYTTIGPMGIDGTLAVTPTLSFNVPTLVNGNTITTKGLGSCAVTAAGAITGLILQTGTQGGQTIFVLNESAFTLTFAASGTSNVADGTADVIAANRGATYVWNDLTALWVRCG